MFYTFQDTAITLQNWNNTSNYSDSGRAIKKCLSTVKVDASSETLTRHTEDVPGYVLQYYQSMVATIAQYLEVVFFYCLLGYFKTTKMIQHLSRPDH